MKSSDLNGGYWTHTGFHKQLANTSAFFVPNHLDLLNPTLPWGKGEAGGSIRAEEKSERQRSPATRSKGQLRSSPERRCWDAFRGQHPDLKQKVSSGGWV